MTSVTIKAIFLLALPLAIFVGGAWMMGAISNRQEVQARLRAVAKAEDQKPLNQRAWYDLADADRHWGALDSETRAAEQLFLELDLVFPFLYGAALATSLLLAWAALGRDFSPLWTVAPVIITVVADWTENLVQLGQLRAYARAGREALAAGWIQVASAATLVKLAFFGISSVLLVVLVGLIVARSFKAG
jgi:hypothetical protein